MNFHKLFYSCSFPFLFVVLVFRLLLLLLLNYSICTTYVYFAENHCIGVCVLFLSLIYLFKIYIFHYDKNSTYIQIFNYYCYYVFRLFYKSCRYILTIKIKNKKNLQIDVFATNKILCLLFCRYYILIDCYYLRKIIIKVFLFSCFFFI